MTSGNYDLPSRDRWRGTGPGRVPPPPDMEPADPEEHVDSGPLFLATLVFILVLAPIGLVALALGRWLIEILNEGW